MPAAQKLRRYALDALKEPRPPHAEYLYSTTHSPLPIQSVPLVFSSSTSFLPKARPYKCIGAKLKILLHCLSLNSFPTTPFNRLPIGSPPLLIKTHALSANCTTLPSGRWYFFAVRTTTAWRMSPRRTLLAAETETLPPGPDSGPKLRCFWTTTMMRSPVEAEGVSGWGG